MNTTTTIQHTYQFYILKLPIIIPPSSSISYVYLLLSFLIYFVQAGKKKLSILYFVCF